MTSQEPKRQNNPEPRQEPGLTLRAVILFVLFALMLPMAMFLTAGTLKWTMAWVYLAIHVFFAIGSRFLAWRKIARCKRNYRDTGNTHGEHATA